MIKIDEHDLTFVAHERGDHLAGTALVGHVRHRETADAQAMNAAITPVANACSFLLASDHATG
jgi:hypothetical protein